MSGLHADRHAGKKVEPTGTAKQPLDTQLKSLESTKLGTAENPLANAPGGAEPPHAGPMPDDKSRYFGDYELLEEIARGGMGVVYQARQVSLNRIVALKMILAGQLASEAEIHRFYTEAEAAANLQHPNIVAIHEVGERRGQHYFSMDYIDGQSLAQIVRESPLSSFRAAHYVEKIADAIEYAHSRGTLHRDLKPANVLIDASDQPRVTDFGLAKRTQGNAQLTSTGSLLGTPSYMPPEQASGRPGQVGPTSDVYSLGAILYELVTGRPPFLGESLVATLNQVLSTEPVAPRLLNSEVPPDLETICLKCLQKEPGRRYATAAALSADLRHFLKNEPIEARPVGTLERTWRWCRRNPTLATLVSAVLLLLLIGGIGGTTLAVVANQNATRADQNAARADQNRQRADQNAQRADQQTKEALAREAETKAVLSFVETRILAAARPEKQLGGLGRDVTLRKALESAVSSLGQSFPNQPLIEARLRLTLATSFQLLGDFKTEAELAEKARALFSRYRGADDPDTLRSMNLMAVSYNFLGRSDQAVKLQEETLGLRKVRLGPDHPDTLMSMNNLAICYSGVGRIADAVKLQEETLALRRARFGPDHPDCLMSMNNLACNYEECGRYADALKLHKETLALKKIKLGPDHPETLTSMYNLAYTYVELGRPADAVKLFEETLSLEKAKLGLDHASTLNSMDALAECYDDLGRHADALKLIEEALKLQKGKYGLDHPHTFTVMDTMANCYRSLGRTTDALKLHQETLALCKAKLGPDHPSTLLLMNDLAETYKALGRHAEALQLREATLKGRKATLGPRHPDTLMSMLSVAESLMAVGRSKEAVPVIREAALSWESLKPTDPVGLYNAARFRAVAAAVLPAADKSPAAADEAALEADRAISWLRQAVAAGYSDGAHMSADSDLDSLRARVDFKKLLAQLQPAAEKKQAMR